MTTGGHEVDMVGGTVPDYKYIPESEILMNVWGLA